MGLGALIIQERMQLTDRETLESISENPYMQYFIGLSGFVMKQPFHHSMMTHFRKRLTDVLAELNEIVVSTGAKETKDDDENNDASRGGGKGKRSKRHAPTAEAEQQMLFVEAAVESSEAAPPVQQTSAEPEALEAVIDALHEPVIGQTAKPRTYREKARK